MKKNLFSHFMLSGLFTVLASFVILGSMLYILTSRFSIAEQRATLVSFADSLAKRAEPFAKVTVSIDYLNAYQTNLDVIAESLDAQVMVVRTQDNKMVFAAQSEANAVSGAVIPTQMTDSVMEVVSRGERFEEWGTLGGVFPTIRNTVGVPVYNEEGQIVAAVFLSSPPSPQGTMDGMTKIFLMSFLVVMFFSIIITFMSTRMLVRPIRQMSAAANRFSKGDLDARVTVQGEGEIAVLARNFNDMASSMSDLEKQRRTFVANVSHDLRTPITSISGFVDGILDGTIPPEDEKKYLQIVSDESKRLSRLVHTLLDISKIESDTYELQLEEFDIGELVRRTMLLFEPAIAEKNLELSLRLPESGPMMIGDRDALTRVVYNLCDNAVKYAYPGGYVNVSLEEDTKNVVFRVKNAGEGIPPEKLPYVFERFYKMDESRGMDRKGLGLGLYIVKTFVEKHGGQIAVNSTEKEDCEFVVVLPKKPKEEKRQYLDR